MAEAAGPSINLSWRELGCRDGAAYPLKWRKDRALVLAQAFEQVREACGNKEIAVLSAYRTEAYNKLVGGAPLSQHTQGRALDIRPPKGMPMAEFADIVLKLAAQPGSRIRGVGFYDRWIHIDTRPSERLVTWDYRRKGLLDGR